MEIITFYAIIIKSRVYCEMTKMVCHIGVSLYDVYTNIIPECDYQNLNLRKSMICEYKPYIELVSWLPLNICYCILYYL